MWTPQKLPYLKCCVLADVPYFDISSVAMGKLSTTPISATNKPSIFPKGKSSSVYQFDPEKFDENSWPILKDMLTKVGCVSGCRLMQSHVHLRKTCNHLATYTLRCTHGVVYQKSCSSTFEVDDIGPGNVVTEFVKRVKTKGAMKSTCLCVFFSALYEFALYVFIYTN